MNTRYTVIATRLNNQSINFETECYDDVAKNIERLGNDIENITIKVTTENGVVFHQNTNLNDLDRVLALAYFVSEKSVEND